MMPYPHCDGGGLLALLPPIKRARLWRLYGQGGGRYLDFWMDGGRDLLGAKGTGLGTAVKAAVDLGISRPLPSVWKRRLERQLAERWPAFPVARFFLNEERALAAIDATFSASSDQAPRRAPGPRLIDPAERGDVARAPAPALAPTPAPAAPIMPPTDGKPATLLVLRPFAEHLADSRAAEEAASACLARLPCSRMLAPAVLLFRDADAAQAVGEDLVPPLVLAAASRSLWELDRFAEIYTEELWRQVDRRLSPYFERSGPFLYARVRPEGYDAFFRAALAAGALLSPCRSLPSLVPGDFDDGELARLQAALARAASGAVSLSP